MSVDPPVCYWCGREIHGAECEGCWEQYTREKNNDIYDTREEAVFDTYDPSETELSYL